MIRHLSIALTLMLSFGCTTKYQGLSSSDGVPISMYSERGLVIGHLYANESCDVLPEGIFVGGGHDLDETVYVPHNKKITLYIEWFTSGGFGKCVATASFTPIKGNEYFSEYLLDASGCKIDMRFKRAGNGELMPFDQVKLGDEHCPH